jgi:hypothetical protein
MFHELMRMGVFSLALVSVSSSASVSETWTVSSELVQAKSGKAKLDRVTFKSGKTSIVYEPSEPPLGMVSSKAVTLGGSTYFVTAWAQGSATTLFRVFAPGDAKEKPICELTSLSETAELREANGRIEISITSTETGKGKWSECWKRK